MAAYIQHIEIATYRTIKDLKIDLQAAPGSARQFHHLILTGPNGSGKSSALEMIAKSSRA